MKPTDKQISTIARHFLIAAIWADSPEGTSPRATKAAHIAACALAREFISECPSLFAAAMEAGAEGYGSHPDAGSPEAAFGHDLWLTLQGHGVGFWDRDELREPPPVGPWEQFETLGEALTDVCHNSRFRDPYSSGRLYFYRGWTYLGTE